MKKELILSIDNKMAKYMSKSALNYFTLTDNFGYEIRGKDNKGQFFNGARLAAEKGRSQIEKIGKKEVSWLPMQWHGEVVAVCGIYDLKKDQKEIKKLFMGLLDEIAYDEFLKSELGKFIDTKSDFVKTLLATNEIKDFDEAIERGDILGVNLRSPQAVILIELSGFFKKCHKKYKKASKEELIIKITEDCKVFKEILSAAFQHYEQNIFACLGEDLFCCIKWAKGEVNTLNTIKFFKEKAEYIQGVVKKQTGIMPTIGVGQYYPGLTGLRKSYEDAKVALSIGKKVWGKGQSYHIVDVGMFVMLSSEVSFERKCELAMQILGPVFSDKDIYRTVSAFLENDMNLSDTARKMHLHRNTLIYRLDKVKKTIGLDPRKFSDAVQIKLGLLLHKPNEKC